MVGKESVTLPFKIQLIVLIYVLLPTDQNSIRESLLAF